jgi:hypothetical protein
MRVVALTQVKNEPILLPVWLKYYSKHFDDIYVSNHGGENDYIDELEKEYKFKRFYDSGTKGWNHQALVDSVKRCQVKLLKKYDYVLYADVDEFVIPRNVTLREYMQGLKKDIIVCTGREVLTYDDEAPIDWSKPLLAQRRKWFPHSAEFKCPISNHASDWALGFHYTKNMVTIASRNKISLEEYIYSQAEPDLYMVHINKIDLSLWNSRGRFMNNKQRFIKGQDALDIEDIPNWVKEIL